MKKNTTKLVIKTIKGAKKGNNLASKIVKKSLKEDFECYELKIAQIIGDLITQIVS